MLPLFVFEVFGRGVGVAGLALAAFAGGNICGVIATTNLDVARAFAKFPFGAPRDHERWIYRVELSDPIDRDPDRRDVMTLLNKLFPLNRMAPRSTAAER